MKSGRSDRRAPRPDASTASSQPAPRPSRRRAAATGVEPAELTPTPARGGNGARRGRRRDAAVQGTIGADDLQLLLAGLRSLRDGDFSVRLDLGPDPLAREMANAFNEVADRNEHTLAELTRISTTVGLQGDMDDRADVGSGGGGWCDGLEALNSLVTGLVAPTIEVARVIKAVAEGDLSQKMVLEIDGKLAQGEFLRIGTTVNRMVDQLNSFAGEVTRVAREVGTDGKLGGQARVEGVAGTWKDLTD